MAPKSDELQLEEVQSAIAGVLAGGQSMSADGAYSYTQADLAALTAREELLLARLARTKRPRVSYAQFRGMFD